MDKLRYSAGMKKLIKVFKRIVATFFVGIAVFLAFAFALSVLSVPAKPGGCETTTEAYLQHNLIHVDIVFRAEDLSLETRDLVSLPSNPEFLVFGLGDRDIYVNTPTWGDLKARYALKALLMPSKRAIHLEPAHQQSSEWIKLDICESQRQALEDYVVESLKTETLGQAELIEGMSYTGHDRFYEANGTYTAFNSCNHWAAGALKAAGVKAPVWSPFAQGVVYHARRP